MSTLRTAPPADATGLDEPRSARHAHLLRHTYRVLVEQGLRRLSLQRVADRAGVSKGILLYYFGTKENLVLATMRWVLARVARRIHTAVHRAPTAEAKVAAMVDAIFVDPRANRDFYLVFLDLLGAAARHDRFDELSATFRGIVDAAYAHIIEEGLREGVFQVPDVAAAASVVRAIVDGLFLQWLQEPDWEARHASTRERCLQAVLGYLRGAPR
ncbi:MAG: TetR/AcrR family transcriptional regulator [Armatimonadota bacterium]|nr:TetR/AcrR family transcriptional regulator [Armatimonadota bacterium]